MCVQHSLSNGARNYDRWISRSVFSVPQSPFIIPTHRASSCSFNPSQPKAGETTKSKCSSAKHLFSIQYGTMRRVISTQSDCFSSQVYQKSAACMYYYNDNNQAKENVLICLFRLDECDLAVHYGLEFLSLLFCFCTNSVRLRLPLIVSSEHDGVFG